MVRKEDVVSWFKELESYKRIDAMCTLLNMCLPFELRFVGAYLEELGKRDFHELRGAELRANTPAELAADVGPAPGAPCPLAEPRTARKMALYVSLLRSCNFACATTLYDVMVSLERSGLLTALRSDLLEEILLLYTMALHHPAFTFDQKSHFNDILERLKPEEEPRRLLAPPQPPDLSVPPPSLAPPPPPGLLYVKASPVQGPSMTGEPVGDMGSPSMPLGPPASMPVMNEVHHPPPGLSLPPYNMAEYVVGQPPWPGGLIVSQINQPIEIMNYPPPVPSSPHASSPADSRPTSPRASLRRPSHDRVSPPMEPPPIATLPANFENLTVSEMRRMDDERLRELGVSPNVVTQLRSVEKLNGLRQRTVPCCPPSRSSGSESGSSAASSPPGTPAPMARRILPNVPPPPGAPFPYMPFNRGFPAYPPNAYRPPPPPFTNGEPSPYPTAGPYAGFMPVLYAPPKLSCWNCGGSGHAGQDCKEPSMEEMTRAGGYQLDFAPPDPGDK